MDYFHSYIDEVTQVVKNMIVTDNSDNAISAEEGFALWDAMTRELQQTNQTMYFIGNGASAMMASHMAADASKNGGIRSLAFNDCALMTAVSNDIAYEECFTIPLKRFASLDDILVTISSSGNSPNIIRAIETARTLGLKVITISGFMFDNRSRQLGDLNFYVPGNTYGIVEASHQIVLHCWLDRFMQVEMSEFEGKVL